MATFYWKATTLGFNGSNLDKYCWVNYLNWYADAECTIGGSVPGENDTAVLTGEIGPYIFWSPDVYSNPDYPTWNGEQFTANPYNEPNEIIDNTTGDATVEVYCNTGIPQYGEYSFRWWWDIRHCIITFTGQFDSFNIAGTYDTLIVNSNHAQISDLINSYECPVIINELTLLGSVVIDEFTSTSTHINAVNLYGTSLNYSASKIDTAFFHDNAENWGSVATGYFYDASKNIAYGAVGTGYFYNTSVNDGTGFDFSFYDDSDNNGQTETGRFHDNSTNSNAVIDKCYVWYPLLQPFADNNGSGGTVVGDTIYRVATIGPWPVTEDNVGPYPLEDADYPVYMGPYPVVGNFLEVGSLVGPYTVTQDGMGPFLFS